MSDAWQSIKVQEFEHVLAAPGIALLRITAKPARRRAGADRRPILAADDGQSVHRFVAIPAPPVTRGVLRAAYSVPAELIQTGTDFSLEVGDGQSLALPAPTPGATRLVPGSTAEGPRSSESDAAPAAPDGSDRRSELIDKLTELSAALAEAQHTGAEQAGALAAAEADAADARGQLAALEVRTGSLESEARQAQQPPHGEAQAEIETLRAARAQSQQELEQARDAVRIMTFERDELTRQAAAFDEVAIKARERAARAESKHEKSEAMLSELQTWRAELERRLAATTTELAAAKASRQEDERRLERLRGELGESEAKVELAQSEIQRLNQRGGPEAVDGDSAADRAELTRMAAELEQLRAAQTSVTPGAQAAATDRIRALEAERHQIAEEAQQLSALLAPAERLAELASELEQARERAESLRAVVSSQLPTLAPSPLPAPSVGAGKDHVDDSALAEARAEIQTLRAKLERAHAANETDQLELIRLSAEADARVQAEQELARAVEARSER